MLISNSVCHQGLVREHNEDSYCSSLEEGVWLVADGVGGNVGGHIASQMVVQTIERKLRQGNSLTSSIEDANQAILSAVSSQSELQGMATTIVAVKFLENKYELAWVGDSRAYLIDQHGIHLLSSDHNVANDLFEKGKISQQEASVHPGQHELTQALGQLSLSHVPLQQGELGAGEILLLCSDGLSGVLSDELILSTLKRATSLKSASSALLKLVLKAGAPDNVTISLIQNKSEVTSNRLPARVNVFNKTPITFAVLLIVALIMALLFYVD